jgi:uncharacterized protein HemX
MSTPSSQPTPAPADQPVPVAEPEPTTEPPAHSTSEGTLANVETTETAPGLIARHTATLIALMVAVIVAAVAIAGVMVHEDRVEDDNNRTEAAFATTVEAQGATLETVECDGDTCAAVIQGQGYTVLVQEDDEGEQHFGVSAYSGD